MRRRRLGAELRRLREAAGLTGEQVIDKLGWASASKLSRLENGRSRPSLDDIENLLDLYQVAATERSMLLDVARGAAEHTRAWLRAYATMTPRQQEFAELEAGCAEICEYAPVIVPGLLQTAEYARVRFQAARPLKRQSAAEHQELDESEEEVAARLARQALLIRGDDPPQYQAVLEETAISARTCPPDVLYQQLEHLRRIAELPNVTLRILAPSAVIGNWYLPETPFSIYRFAERDDPSAVAVETLSSNLVLDETALDKYSTVFTWLCAAARSPEESLRWLDEAAWHASCAMTTIPLSSSPGAPRPRPASDDGVPSPAP